MPRAAAKSGRFEAITKTNDPLIKETSHAFGTFAGLSSEMNVDKMVAETEWNLPLFHLPFVFMGDTVLEINTLPDPFA